MTIKMPMRWTFFWILLAFSHTPLVVISTRSQRGTHRLGKTIADDTRRTLSDLMTRSLEDTMARLSGLTPLLGYLTERCGGDLLRVHVTLAGGVHLAYPGHGDFPVDFNPRWTNSGGNVRWKTTSPWW